MIFKKRIFGAISDDELPSCPTLTGVDYNVVNNGNGTQTFTITWDAVGPPATSIHMAYSNPYVGVTGLIIDHTVPFVVTVPLGLTNFFFYTLGECEGSFIANLLNVGFEESATIGVCIQWTAINLNDIKMSLDFEVDLTTILAGRSINTTPGFSVGTITSYVINGTTVPCSLDLTFTATTGTFSTDALPHVAGEVLTSLTFYLDILCTNVTEFTVGPLTISGVEVPGEQITAEYDNCL